MSKHRSHKHVPYDNLLQGLNRLFTPGRHTAIYLSEKVVKFSKLQRDELGRLQKLAVHRIHNERVFDLRDQNFDIADEDVAKAYFKFFDELFFFRSVKDSKRFSLVLDNKHKEEGYWGGLVVTLPGQNSGSLKNYQIVLFKPQHESRYDGLKVYITSVLQEMIQVFLLLWQCNYPGCSSYPNTRGYAWQEIALALEIAVNDGKFLILDLDLERMEALVEDSIALPDGVIDDDLLRRWGLDKKDFRRRSEALKRRRRTRS